LWKPPGGDFGIALINGGQVITANAPTTTQVNDGVFHSVIVTRSTVTDTVKTYIDGVLEASYKLIPTNLTGMPWIGLGNNPCDMSFNRRWFAGDLDELRFYNRVLSPTEIGLLSGRIVAGVPAGTGKSVFTSVWPNPSLGPTDLQFSLPRAMEAKLDVYDLRGARVRTLKSGHWRPGMQTLTWFGTDDRGRPAGPGVYLVVFRSGDLTEMHKVILME